MKTIQAKSKTQPPGSSINKRSLIGGRRSCDPDIAWMEISEFKMAMLGYWERDASHHRRILPLVEKNKSLRRNRKYGIGRRWLSDSDECIMSVNPCFVRSVVAVVFCCCDGTRLVSRNNMTTSSWQFSYNTKHTHVTPSHFHNWKDFHFQRMCSEWGKNDNSFRIAVCMLHGCCVLVVI